MKKLIYYILNLTFHRYESDIVKLLNYCPGDFLKDDIQIPVEYNAIFLSGGKRICRYHIMSELSKNDGLEGESKSNPIHTNNQNSINYSTYRFYIFGNFNNIRN